MANYVTRVATIEIPVSNIEASVKWYAKALNLVVQHKTEKDAMLSFNAKGVPSLYLVQTDEQKRIDFVNSHTNITHSVIDFYTYDLEGYYEFLQSIGVEVGPFNARDGKGGFGFKDPDGNHLSACNIVQIGQE